MRAWPGFRKASRCRWWSSRRALWTDTTQRRYTCCSWAPQPRSRLPAGTGTPPPGPTLPPGWRQLCPAHADSAAPAAARYLVYFTTAASSPSATAAQDLRPAVDALLRVPPDSEPAPATGSPAAAGTKGRAEGGGTQGEQGGSPARPDFRPRVLVMGFYQQATAVELDPEAHIPPNVALCPMPDGGLEYSQVGAAPTRTWPWLACPSCREYCLSWVGVLHVPDV